MNNRLLMTLQVQTAQPRTVGAVPLGTRTMVAVTGGTFTGPRLRGKVREGGSDWTLLRSDHVLELALKLTLETDDGALIDLSSFGLRHGPPDVMAGLARGEAVDPARYYFRTAPRFETSVEKYSFLNRMVAISIGDRRPEGPIYSIFEII